MESEDLKKILATLIDEGMKMQAQVAALRYACFALTAASPDATQNLRALSVNVDGYTLPVLWSEAQRELVKEEIDLLITVSQAAQRVAFPGGANGLKIWLRAGLRAVWRVLFGEAAVAKRIGEPEPYGMTQAREYLKGK